MSGVPILVPALFAANGASAASGAKLYAYLKGTTTPQTFYTDEAIATPAANPTIANSLGATVRYLDPSKNYDLVAKTSDDATTLFSVTYNVDANNITLGPGQEAALEGSFFQFATYAALTAATNLVDGQAYYVRARATTDDGGAGWFRYNAASTATADNGVTLAIDGGGAGRFFRLFDGDEIDARWFGAFTSGATALATINAAISYCSTNPLKITLAGQTVTLSAQPTNTYGVPLINGKIIVPSGSYTTQDNTYTTDGQLLVGREHLTVFHRFVFGASSGVQIYVFGDSTVEQNGSYLPNSTTLIQRSLRDAGYNHCTVNNSGVSGTSWSDLSALASLGANTPLIVIKYGINDAVKSTPLATLAADMDSKLTAIRAYANGGYSSLSILLYGPSATHRPVNSQDAKWYEDLRNIYLAAAHKHRCAFFDGYAWMPDARDGPGLYLDSIAPDNGGIHPDTIHHWRYWREPWGMILGNGYANPYRSVTHWNVTHDTEVVYPTNTPQEYSYGLSAWGVLSSDGWPADGNLIVYRQADGNVVQTLHTLDVQPRRYSRTGSGTTWTQWIGVRTAVSAFTNSWVNKGGGYTSAGYVLLDNGMVKLYGVVKDGTVATSIFTLPSNLRPSAVHLFSDGAGSNITVWPNGSVIAANGTTTTISLDDVLFPAVN